MAKKLTQKKIDKMFKAYCERQTAFFVAKKCHISVTTAKKYIKKEKWAERVLIVKQKAIEKQDEHISDIIADNLKCVRFVKDEILENIKNGKIASRNPASDLDKIIRLELLLVGESDSRIEIKDSPLIAIDDMNLTLQVRKELLKAMRKKQLDAGIDD